MGPAGGALLLGAWHPVCMHDTMPAQRKRAHVSPNPLIQTQAACPLPHAGLAPGLCTDHCTTTQQPARPPCSLQGHAASACASACCQYMPQAATQYFMPRHALQRMGQHRRQLRCGQLHPPLQLLLWGPEGQHADQGLLRPDRHRQWAVWLDCKGVQQFKPVHVQDRRHSIPLQPAPLPNTATTRASLAALPTTASLL